MLCTYVYRIVCPEYLSSAIEVWLVTNHAHHHRYQFIHFSFLSFIYLFIYVFGRRYIIRYITTFYVHLLYITSIMYVRIHVYDGIRIQILKNLEKRY